MGNVLEKFFPTPTEEFPATGVRTVDDITNNVKLVIETAKKPQQMIQEYKDMKLTPPAEATEVYNDANELYRAPQTILSENARIVSEIPKVLENPSKILADPANFAQRLKELIGDPEKLVAEYRTLIEKFKQLAENSQGLVGNANKYIEDYKNLIEGEYTKILTYLKDLPEMVPVIQECIEKLGTFEESLKAELAKFSGGLCSAARSMQLIKHNLNSVQKYKTQYESELGVAQEVVAKAIEKRKEVEDMVEKAKTMQQEAENTIKKVQDTRQTFEHYQTQANDWITKVRDLQNKQEQLKNMPTNLNQAKDYATNVASNVYGQFKNFI